MGARDAGIRRARRAVQVTVFALAAAAPFLDLLRLDLPGRSLVFLRQPLYLSHFWVLLLFVLLLVYGFVALNLVFGRVFCGWVCPQTLVSEMAEGVAALLGGRRAPLAGRADPRRLRGPRRAAYYLAAAAASLAGGFVLAAYFVPPATLVAVLAERSPAADRPVWILFLGLSAGLFLNAAFLRHRLCTVCPLGAAQFVLRGDRTLQVALDPRRAEDCAHCTACARACPMDLDPRDPDLRHCLNCGECLVACGLLSARRGVSRPIGWWYGRPRPAAEAEPAGAGPGGLPRARLVFLGSVLLVLLSFFSYGLVTRSRLGLAVVRHPRGHVVTAPDGRSGGRYLVVVRNQGARPGTFRLEVRDLPPGWERRFARDPVRLDPGREARVTLEVFPGGARAAPGVYRFRVTATEAADPGWNARAHATLLLTPGARPAAGSR